MYYDDCTFCIYVSFKMQCCVKDVFSSVSLLINDPFLLVDNCTLATRCKNEHVYMTIDYSMYVYRSRCVYAEDVFFFTHTHTHTHTI